jgi:catechol 2,3-dioxygenase-like lactoylglutathione lyase family enzyme
MTTLRTSLAFAAALCTSAIAQEGAPAPAKNFSTAVADIGIVVQDLEKSAKFYTEALGMTEVKGFSVSADNTTRFGLADDEPATIRVFVLDDAEGQPSTKFKLMAFPAAPGAKQDQKFIHSTIGISYLTLYVTDTKLAVERAKKAGVKLLGETPADLGGGTFITVFHDPDGNFIELIGPSK